MIALKNLFGKRRYASHFLTHQLCQKLRIRNVTPYESLVASQAHPSHEENESMTSKQFVYLS